MNGVKGFFALVGILTILVTGSPGVSTFPEEPFSFVIIADPHIDGNEDHRAKLEKAVDCIIAYRESYNIELVFVVGDIAWGGSAEGSHLDIAKTILDDLNDAGIPYLPLIGDNEVQSGFEEEFDIVFSEQYQYLAGFLNNWQRAPTPVSGKYLQNFSFDHKFCHFACADFASREAGDEGGELHDFAGGSWPWIKDDISHCLKTAQENIVIATHIGMFRTGVETADQYLFSKSEMNEIKSFITGYRNYVDTNYSGHVHQNWWMPVMSSFRFLYHARTTDETWYDTRWPESHDEALTLRLVYAREGTQKIVYSQHVVDID